MRNVLINTVVAPFFALKLMWEEFKNSMNSIEEISSSRKNRLLNILLGNGALVGLVAFTHINNKTNHVVVFIIIIIVNNIAMKAYEIIKNASIKDSMFKLFHRIILNVILGINITLIYKVCSEIYQMFIF